jgi:hypothetical protein
MPPIGWLKAVRKICDDLEVLMIADEVITGFGRTGRWFGVEHDGVVPDIMSVAKGITSGYIPLSAAIARRKLADAFPEDTVQENVHPNTYAAHPVACAAGLANLQIMRKDNLVENAAVMGHGCWKACEAPSAPPRSSARCGAAASWSAPSSSSPTAQASRSTRTAWPSSTSSPGTAARSSTPATTSSASPPALHHGRGGRPARRNGRRQHQRNGEGPNAIVSEQPR